MSNIPADVYLTIGGLALLIAAPLAHCGRRGAGCPGPPSRCWGPSRAEELEHRVEAPYPRPGPAVVDAADAERRRAGAETCTTARSKRLVSLAMNLGMARAQTETVEEAHEAIAEAHEEAKAALAELRKPDPRPAPAGAREPRPWTRPCPGWPRGCRSRSG